MATSSNRQNSRFSTLKVFKFASAPKPPPPPPKDPYYRANPSLASLTQSLSPEAFSPPYATRTAPSGSSMYASSARSPSPTPSYTPSYVPSFAASRTTLAPSANTTPSEPSSSNPRKGFFKFASLGKRPKASKFASTNSSTVSVDQTSEPTEDPSISLPWNFQHNVHVDEAFVGLPPTWSASLAEMGFSEEEIANIHARRAASRPTLYALNSDRPESPASSTFSTRSRPNPRSSSLMRRDNDAVSQRSDASYAADVSRELSMSTDNSDVLTMEDTASAFSTSTRTYRSPEAVYASSGQTTTLPGTTRPARPPDSTYNPLSQLPSTPSVRSPETSYASPSQFPLPPMNSGPSPLLGNPKDPPSRTPVKRSYHVTNDSIGTIASPPPAYRSPKKDAALNHVEEGLVSPPAVPMEDLNMDRESEREEESEELTSDSISVPSAQPFTLPPRLSLHQDTFSDLSNWTESLFSMIPSTPPKPSRVENEQSTGLSTSGRTAAAVSSTTPARPRSPSRSTRASPSNGHLSPSSRQLQTASQKPAPLHLTPDRTAPPPSPSLPSLPSSSASSNPLWHEVYNMVKSPDSGPSSPAPSAIFTPSSSIAGTSPASSDETRLDSNELQVDFTREKENRDSNMSTMTVTPATIVRHVSVVKRARANVITSPPRPNEQASTYSCLASSDAEAVDDRSSALSARSNSPVSSESNSSEGSSIGMSVTSGSGSTSSPSSRPTTLAATETDKWKTSSMVMQGSSTVPYVETSPLPSPRVGEFDHSSMITSAAVRSYRESEEVTGVLQRPSILIDSMPLPDEDNATSPWSLASTSPSPSTPALRYSGWVTQLVAPIHEFIDDSVDPRDLFMDLQMIAEGESGSVYAAKPVESRDDAVWVAIKQVALIPSGSPKLAELETELRIMKGALHPQILAMESLYIDLVEDSLWITMELMDRSLADILTLLEEGIEVNEAHISLFAKDVLMALSFLQSRGIAHRDVRSDNLLVNSSGVVKLADFSNAFKVSSSSKLSDEPAGVLYWRAPEMRSGLYNPLKVDVWSLGATVWEMAQGQPPFADATDDSQIKHQLPPLDHPQLLSRSFHDFLQLCSKPCQSRPDPDQLLNTPFICNANDRSAVVKLLAQCRSAEGGLSRRQSTDSQGTVSLP